MKKYAKRYKKKYGRKVRKVYDKIVPRSLTNKDQIYTQVNYSFTSGVLTFGTAAATTTTLRLNSPFRPDLASSAESPAHVIYRTLFARY